MQNHFEEKTASGAEGASLPEFVATRVTSYFDDRVGKAWAGGHIMRGRQPGPDALHLSSNDYLSISKHPDILRAMSDSIQSEGNGLLMSGIFLHGDNPLLALEDRFARFMRSEASILCQSGYAANTGLIQSIATPETPVYVDMMAHMSLWEGIRAAGAKAIAFSHNDAEHLGRQIRRNGPGVVIVDSVYSTNGSMCPLTAVVETGVEHGCVLVVDESHSLGTHGPGGAGLVVALGLADRVHFRTASLAKAFAARAGVISCSARFQEYFKFESRPAIFSSTLLPHEIAGLDATISVIERESWRRVKVESNAQYLRAQLTGLGYNLNGSASQIIALESGTEQRTILLRDALESRGIFGSVFCAPATAQNRALMRLSVHASLTQGQLRRIVHACEAIREAVGLADWASTRRMRATPVAVAELEPAKYAA
ncbi:alpha-hydroxyketone-type quorum-sensing autoinducer synthase [Trinickia dinghuensis]|uniref:Quorum-sensing autoinducer synthase n=1 Tax=Trinickia dinghuensis TaxID=2291023 RepID=A0A3D8K7F0_9BURK|nr:alpha-hydroxyketone-type quorum-sensing autoinducer synthase [Trinickia dinghuensis]RDV00826.1 quorum-sensing autoinducer synthase [Trinickia dinghuensis]